MKLFAIIIFFVLSFLKAPSPRNNFIDQSSDTLTVKLADQKDSWWSRNEGTLLGTLGGALIAILAAFTTYYLSRCKTLRKERKVYEGILYSIHTELSWQKNRNRMLRSELSQILRLSLKKEEFIVDKAPDSFHTKYIELCRERILEYDKFNHKILAFLSTYINLLLDANRYVDFSTARRLDISKKSSSKRKEMIKQYFDTIEENSLSKIDHIIPRIRSKIEEELKDFPEDLLINPEIKND